MSIHRTFTRQQTERILGIHKGSCLAWLKGSNPESNTGGAYLFGIFLRFFPTESVRRVREWIERGAKVKSGFHFNSIRLGLLLVRLANATQRWLGRTRVQPAHRRKNFNISVIFERVFSVYGFRISYHVFTLTISQFDSVLSVIFIFLEYEAQNLGIPQNLKMLFLRKYRTMRIFYENFLLPIVPFIIFSYVFYDIICYSCRQCEDRAY